MTDLETAQLEARLAGALIVAQDLDHVTTTLRSELEQRDQILAAISKRHVQEPGMKGLVGDRCAECSPPWPCVTRRILDGEQL